MNSFLIGLAIGLVVALVVLIWQSFKRSSEGKVAKAEISHLKEMLNDRMDLESEGISRLKKDNEELKKQNENLRITNANLMQKTDKAELQRLAVYQKAVERLVINSPGFGAAWQSALSESEEDFKKIYNGSEAFWKKIIPGRSDAKLIEDAEDSSVQDN